MAIRANSFLFARSQIRANMDQCCQP